MTLYMNNDVIGYQAIFTGVDEEKGNPDAYVSMVFQEAPEYVIEHEFRRSSGKSLRELVDENLEK